MIKAVNKFFLYRKYRKRIKLRKKVNFRVSNPGEFLRRLEKNNIAYLSLRWPDEVATVMAGKRPPGVDIDILVRVKSWKEIFNVTHDLIKKTNTVKFDVYSQYGIRGFTYKSFPYYPPHLCDELFKHKTRNKAGFYCAGGASYIQSLAYHLIYHKGIDFDAPHAGGVESNEGAKRPYTFLLKEEARKQGVKLPDVPGNRALYDWLETAGFSMPYDLLIQYRTDDECHLAVMKKWEEEKFRPIGEGKYIYIFMLRDGIENTEYENTILRLIGNDFVIQKKIRIDKENREDLKRKIRGGNWYDTKTDRETWPYLFIIAEDPSPKKLTEPDKLHPLVDNRNFYAKLKIRNKFRELTGSKSNCIHGTDNPTEAAYIASLLESKGYI